MTIKKTPIRPRLNLGQIAYNEIKDMILTGELEPGERLVLDELSRTLNLSVTPIRDALNKLEQEDLVVITPRTSHCVVNISAEDAADILDLRLTLEMYALQTAGNGLAAFPVDEFRTQFDHLAKNENVRDFIATDNRFHSAILAISPNRRLPKLYSYLQNLIQVISIQALKKEGRIAKANNEHLELLNAIEQLDIDLAISCLKKHFSEMRGALLVTISGSSMEQPPV